MVHHLVMLGPVQFRNPSVRNLAGPVLKPVLPNGPRRVSCTLTRVYPPIIQLVFRNHAVFSNTHEGHHHPIIAPAMSMIGIEETLKVTSHQE